MRRCSPASMKSFRSCALSAAPRCASSPNNRPTHNPRHPRPLGRADSTTPDSARRKCWQFPPVPCMRTRSSQSAQRCSCSRGGSCSPKLAGVLDRGIYSARQVWHPEYGSLNLYVGRAPGHASVESLTLRALTSRKWLLREARARQPSECIHRGRNHTHRHLQSGRHSPVRRNSRCNTVRPTRPCKRRRDRRTLSTERVFLAFRSAPFPYRPFDGLHELSTPYSPALGADIVRRPDGATDIAYSIGSAKSNPVRLRLLRSRPTASARRSSGWRR